MKAHVEIYIRLDLPDGKTLHDVLREFAEQTKGWIFPLENSLDYQSGHRSQAGFVVSQQIKGIERGAIAIANLDEKLPNHFRVPNIVPRDCFHLSMDKYNDIGTAFVKAFRHFLRTNKIGGFIKMAGPNKGLADIIKGEKCRKLFEVWLHSPTPVSHPADLEKLYVFICALFRHHSDARSYEIERFLIDDRKWKPSDARFVSSEIEKGLTLLRINQKF